MLNDKAIRQSKIIYWSSGIVSICGIIFEVLFGALGSYILGDGVKQYTLTISLFLTGMGIGASLSEKFMRNLIIKFVWIEFCVALIGGFSSFIMFGITAFAPAGTDAFYLYSITLIIGALTGVELPILIRKANEIGVTLNKSTARVLFSDYAGGLIGGVLFVFLFRPYFGMVKTAFLVGLINLTVALIVLWLFRKEIRHFIVHAVIGGVIGVLLIAGLFFGEEMAFNFEQKLYQDPIIHMEESSYQKITVTQDEKDIRLYLDGSLQFSSVDEHRYHEVLVHPAMANVETPENVLILGGGDGIAAKEVLKYQDVKQVTLVDLDPAVVELANENRHLLEINEGALMDEKVEVKNMDAFQFLEDTSEWYDVILVDLPDPNNESLNKLYTKEFYSLVRNHLKPEGTLMVQATSPVFAREVYWTISETISSTNLNTENLHVDVPSFGNWGFVMASREEIDLDIMEIPVSTRFLTDDMMPALTAFGKDEDQQIPNFELKANTLIDPHLIQIYEKAWENY
ncbi:spermidine synthase [Oceanobacillus iheyensis HTE831]|uniref:Polyamine aminopropyltransferase n=1 Tax=Oceanobacillus iheyensis (strain DSM 14371 / CIP 107618 / JCM 11309 / KCTC 3954 / HTE831) TaxID=221109 RepID=SPEE_OCEIH|nr:polyamine aminopropyltransferase [Oceanobacillus iheyensis]Q8CV14.1 RecName: Full=Polyamine aminopropyltransferase; AltName: Full=Putrescine aminopropyltransferase; Short=PAPT; AltName: Full=Spermidine synthase; Short=SPDS; Short=SPDSY [Oceanobacillus iheyensis HTE831]BAC12899.1 spermidine synthase [Oceanobacillus iheyensis HTE831]